jgi:glycosyltransferase involved in cell wall biosynthesis
MKVAHIVCTFPPYKGGMGNSVYNFAKVLTKLGHDVVVFTPTLTPSPSYRRVALREGEAIVRGRNEQGEFRVIRLKSFLKFGNAAFLPQLFWRLNGFDIVHLHYPFFGSASVILLRRLIFRNKTKLIIHYHMEPTAKGIKGLVFRLSRLFIEPLLMGVADIITCASLDYVKHSGIAGYYEKHKEKFREVLFGVDLIKFRKQKIPAAHRTVRRAENRKQKNNNKNILFVGGLDKAHYFKGVDVLLKAASQLSIINYQLSIIGDGDMRAYYEKLVLELGIADRVNFVGNVDNEGLAEYYLNSDVLVLPSINQGEAFGLVLLEAMASGKPVIASRLPGVRSVFEDGKQGFLVKPGDILDLAEKLKIILNDSSLAQMMGKAGRKLVEEKYTWEKVGERLDDIYRNLL